ncbi:MAG TPA: glycosyltransferase family 2 protein [Desulfarculaceae bacterium]|nr:glycosyltransferase family 2 protein [Desulfarculaceae bacterium]
MKKTVSNFPLLSIIVVFFNMAREAERTLYTLSSGYQKDVNPEQYEVIVIDNGSSEPLTRENVESFGSNFHYLFNDTESSSPVAIINESVAHCRGAFVMVMIDGAHMLSPGIIANALRVFQAFADPFITVVGFHLGPEIQNSSVSKGYDQEVEDDLLMSVDWQHNGYSLFKLSQSLSYDCAGWFGPLMESNCLLMRKASFLRIGGFNPSFTEVGGGLAILDLFHTAVKNHDLEYVVLLGEGSFHQFHGGVASNAAYAEHPWERFHDQYEAIKGHPFQLEVQRPFYFGEIPAEATPWSRLCAEVGLKWWEQRDIFGDEISTDTFGYAMTAARADREARQAQDELEQKFYDLQYSYNLLAEKHRCCEMELNRERKSLAGRIMVLWRRISRMTKNNT